MPNNQGVPASPSGHSGFAPSPDGLGHSESVPNADYFPAVMRGVQRLMELDRKAGSDLSAAIGEMRAVELGMGRNNVAPIWRCAVSDTISAVDVLLRRWRKGRLRSRREAAREIDEALQLIHDARMLRKPGTYAEANEAGDVLRAAAAQGIEAGTATTEGCGPKDESPVTK